MPFLFRYDILVNNKLRELILQGKNKILEACARQVKDIRECVRVFCGCWSTADKSADNNAWNRASRDRFSADDPVCCATALSGATTESVFGLSGSMSTCAVWFGDWLWLWDEFWIGLAIRYASSVWIERGNRVRWGRKSWWSTAILLQFALELRRRLRSGRVWWGGRQDERNERSAEEIRNGKRAQILKIAEEWEQVAQRNCSAFKYSCESERTG